MFKKGDKKEYYYYNADGLGVRTKHYEKSSGSFSQVPVTKTPDSFIFSELDAYNDYCLEMYNSVYLSDEWSWISENERKAILADNMIIWDPENTIKIGIVQGGRAVDTIIEEAGDILS